MIAEKTWRGLKVQLNKLANFVWAADPIGQMQYEYDLAVVQLRDGRQGLEQYRALVERVSQQVETNRQRGAKLEAKVRAYLAAGDRDAAARFALELQQAQQQQVEYERQPAIHEEAYNHNVAKIKQAGKKLAAMRDKVQRYAAELKMSNAEAELTKLASDFNYDVTTDFGQIEQMINDKINLNRAKVRVTSDLSGEGTIDIHREEAAEAALAAEALKQFEQRLCIASSQNRMLEHRD